MLSPEIWRGGVSFPVWFLCKLSLPLSAAWDCLLPSLPPVVSEQIRKRSIFYSLIIVQMWKRIVGKLMLSHTDLPENRKICSLSFFYFYINILSNILREAKEAYADKTINRECQLFRMKLRNAFQM